MGYGASPESQSAIPTLSRSSDGFVGILTEHRLMFVASFCLYFLFGAALFSIGPNVQIEAAQRFYPINATEALRSIPSTGCRLRVEH